MQLFVVLAHSQVLYLSCVLILGLAMGSFLNVVIWRLPRMLQNEWEIQCQSFLEEQAATATEPLTTKPIFNLLTPRSVCPTCRHPLSMWDNIPLLSFLWLGAKCRYCQHAISWRYPFVEVSTALLSAVIAAHFGVHWHTLAALMLTWGLIALAVIDFDEQILPDDITLPLLWLGLAFNISGGWVSLSAAVLGAICGYGFLWSIYWLFKLLTHKEGMGYGDFKLLAMLGAWLGWQALPLIIFLSSLLGAMLGIGLILSKRHQKSQPFCFGPFLALAGWISLIWGDKITAYYLKWAHLT